MTMAPPANPTPTPGRVILIGAGPGDPGLITVAGLNALRRATVVVYDALANPRLLDEASADALRIDVGKRAKAHTMTQDQIQALMLEHARAGQTVARLKGGDPYLFGRGAEEVGFLAGHGIACEVIPGVTAGIAGPATAGIPVTHRQMASTLTFVTGHEDPTKEKTSVDYAALARLAHQGGTLCFYMGVGRLASIFNQLINQGLSNQTPAALIQWGTLATQRSVRGTLATLEARVTEAGLGSPAIIVVGQVAGLDEPGLNWFTDRPLFGRTVLITRTRSQASQLRELLEAQGARVIEAPSIQVDFAPVDAVALKAASLSAPGWLVLTSANAVQWLAQWLAAHNRDARLLSARRIAVVGPATAQALQDALSLQADFVPPTSNGPALGEALIKQEALAGQDCLLLRGDLADGALPQMLADAGAKVHDQTVYHTRTVASLPEEALAALRAGEVDWITCTSASTLTHLLRMLDGEQTLLAKTAIASIGPITSDAVRQAGFDVAVQATAPSVQALVQAMADAAASGPTISR